MYRKTWLSALCGLLLASGFARAQQEPNAEAFMNKFEVAAGADSFVQMQELVKKNRDHIVDGFMMWETLYCSAVANNSTADVKTRMNVLEKLSTINQLENKDKYLAERLTWTKALTPEACGKKAKMWEYLSDGDKAIKEANNLRTPEAFQKAIDIFSKFVPIAEEITDGFWMINGNYWLGEGHKGKLEYFEACYHYKKAVESGRDTKMMNIVEKYGLMNLLRTLAQNAKIREDLIDVKVPLEKAKTQYKEAEEKAAASPGGGAGGGGTAIPTGVTNAPPLANKHTLKIDWVDGDKPKYKEIGPRTFLTPNYQANSHWLFWHTQEVNPGKPEKFKGIPGDSEIKNEKGKLLFDPDGSGKAPEDKLKVPEGKTDVVAFKGRKYSEGTEGDVFLRMMSLPSQYKLMGFDLKDGRAPSEKPIVLKWIGSTAVTTKFNGVDIAVYDDSGDGNFVGYGEDSVVVGTGKTARVQPLSKYIYIGDLLFEMKLEASGAGIRFKPYDGPIALLKFDYKSTTNPAFMIAEGVGEQANISFNLMDAKDKPMWVPPGRYRFRNGYFAYGEGDRRETILVEQGKSAEFGISEGKLNTIAMGAAKDPGFTFVWKADTRREKGEDYITIVGKDIKVFGCGGEEYRWFSAGVFKPTVHIKSAKEGPDAFSKEMKPPAREDLDDKHPALDVVYFPKTFDVKKPVAGEVFLQLECDYPKLGKITSTPTPLN